MSMPPKYKLETLHEAQSGLGFLANMGQIDGHVFASGGTYHRSTWLHASDGRRFEARSTPETSGLRGMFVESLERIYVVGEYGTLAVTADQGRSWQPMDEGLDGCLYRIIKADETLLVCSDNGLYGSDDEGASWSHIYNSSGRLLGLQNDGGRVLGWGADNHLLLYKEGRCDNLSVPTYNTLTGAIRTPGGALMICGDGGQLFRSADDGESWDTIKHQHKGDFEDIAAVQGQILAVGGSGTLLHSGDDGQTFHALKTHTRATLWSLCPVKGGAYIGCDRGQIMHIALDVDEPDEPSPASAASSSSTRSGKEPKKR